MEPTQDDFSHKAPRIASALEKLGNANYLISDITGKLQVRQDGDPQQIRSVIDALMKVDEQIGTNIDNLSSVLSSVKGERMDRLDETLCITRMWRGTNNSIDLLEDILKMDGAQNDREQIKELIEVINKAGTTTPEEKAEPAINWTKEVA